MTITLSLLEQVSSIDFLRKAWTSLNKTNKLSKGLSNETIELFSSNLEQNIRNISQQLLSNKYVFSSVKAVVIEKKKKDPKDINEEIKYRPLRIAEVRDRLVQKAITLKLDEILSNKFNLVNECSFAYRKNTNVEQAINKMKEYYAEGYKYILEADIKKFFDNVDREKLINVILESLPDDTLNSLFRNSLEQELSNPNNIDQKVIEDYFTSSENGIPQGNSLSPLLANIYLSDFDRIISEKGYKMIRYADDFIIMCTTMEDAYAALDLSKEILEQQLRLEIHELGDERDPNAKTRIVNPAMHKFSFLSIRFDGKRCWVKEEKYNSFKNKIIELTTISASNKQKNMLDILKSLRNTLEGWIASYHFVDLSAIFPELDKLVNRQLYLLLNSFGLSVKKSALKKDKFKGKSNEVITLNNHQRFNLGIPSCQIMLNKMLHS